jgi:uncharacterized GH25 family protein
MKRIVLTIAMLAMMTSSALAHDAWLETNTNLLRSGDSIYIDLKLGNHGNDHRDFKQAGKVQIEKVKVEVVDPNGKKYDLTSNMVDQGYTPKEGYWTGKFSAFKPGVYTAAATSDTIVNHGQAQRSLKSAKTFFHITESLDKPTPDDRVVGKVLGHAMELVPIVNPVLPMAAGKKFQVQLVMKGQPVANEKVSCIPQGHELKEGFDAEYEFMTDEEGIITFTPKEGNRYLFVSHVVLNEKGDGYDATKYTATLTLFVPDLCMCCE